MLNKKITAIVAVQICFCILLSVCPNIYSDGFVTDISSADDFIRFSKVCTLDENSVGKTVNLRCDIDLSDKEFKPVPIFCGTFNGNGYAISGIDFSDKGSYSGVFRYLNTDGKISNLHVKGKFMPGGSKSFTGGIVGENSGTIENCTFDGNIKGENVIGGIVGYNTEQGRIISCHSYGSVIGENSTGGISGKNSGLIQNCVNDSAVNTVYEEKKKSLTDIDTDAAAISENKRNDEEENKEESVLGHTDTGGITGYSDGILQGCTNNGYIGYAHIGYNVGGISGRQSGYMLGCKNYGEIQGRKDVGGISGQAEPYVLLNNNKKSFEDINKELENLNKMVNSFITDTDNLSNDTEKRLNEISGYTKNARNNAENLINQGTDFIDDNLSEINAEAAIISNTIDKISPVLESLENSGDDITKSFKTITDCLDDIDVENLDLDDEMQKIKDAAEKIASSEESIKKSISKLSRAIDNFSDAIRFRNSYDCEKAAEDISNAIDEIIQGKQDIKKDLEEIQEILKINKENFKKIDIDTDKLVENLKDITENTKVIIDSLKTINSGVKTLISNFVFDYTSLKNMGKNLQSALKNLNNAATAISKGLSDMGDGIKEVSDKLSEYTDDLKEELSKAKNGLSDGLKSLSNAVEDVDDSVDKLKNIIDDLAEEETFEFIKLGDDFKKESENLFDSLSGISDELNELKDDISDKQTSISDDLMSISDQFNVILNLIIGEAEDVTNGEYNLSDIFIDVSEEELESAKQGKIQECQNFGKVMSDRNTGGIIGALSIEYSKDPEDELEKPESLNFTYRSRAIVYQCMNEGEITGKKDCTGGVVGNAELGTIYSCENYGKTESTNGNYVGGIAGKTETSIRKSYAKSYLSGKRYIGGVTGKGDKLNTNYAIVNVNGDENIGAVCGDSENKDNLHKNFYTDNGLGGIDGISYKDKAESISYDLLKNISGIPDRFISFTVTFIAENRVIDIQEIKYDEKVSKIKYPNIPDKKGYYGRWKNPETDTIKEDIKIECEYFPYIKILSSEEKNENGKMALALCEGSFTDEARLHIEVRDVNNIGSLNIPVEYGENTKVYDVKVENSDFKDSDEVTIRILNENKEKVKVWILKDSQAEEVKTTAKGKYTVLKMTGPENTVCINYQKRGFNFLYVLLIIGIAAAGFVILKFVKAKKSK